MSTHVVSSFVAHPTDFKYPFLPPPTVTPAFHEVSVYPKKELPFFILFTAGLCSFTAMLAMLTHQFPELMGVFAKAVSTSTAGGSINNQISNKMLLLLYMRFVSIGAFN